MKGKARKRSHSYSMLTRDWRGAHHRSLIDWICVVAPLYLWLKGSAMSSFVHFNRDWGKCIFFCQNFQTTNQELHGNQTASDRPPKVKPGKVWFKSPKSFKSVLLHDFLSLRENLFSWKVLKETWQLKVNCIWNLEKRNSWACSYQFSSHIFSPDPCSSLADWVLSRLQRSPRKTDHDWTVLSRCRLLYKLPLYFHSF